METQHAEQPAIASSLYRRLPMDWWRSALKKGKLHILPVSRFKPNSNDADGLSVSQARLSTIEQASTTATGKRDCLAEFPTSVATGRGLTVEPKPTERDPGHAVIPEMNFAAMQDPETEAIVEEHALALAQASKVTWPTEGDPPPNT
ncbi:MAG: hypothetical protein ACTS3F_06305 [Phycisphaerales bacterium]